MKHKKHKNQNSTDASEQVRDASVSVSQTPEADVANDGATGAVPEGAKPMSFRKKLLWTLLFAVIAVATVFAVSSYSKSLSAESFWEYLSHASLPMIGAGLLCTVGFVYFEGAALRHICRCMGFPVKRRDGLLYSAADIYFSAITPSATGGQPASAYFMLQDGIPGAVLFVALLLNLAAYTVAILILGILGLIFCPQIFFGFDMISRILVLIGVGVQIAFTAFFYLLLRHGSILHRLGDALIRFFAKLHLVRNAERKREKLTAMIADYQRYSADVVKHGRLIGGALFYNVLQRLAQTGVAVCAFLATGGAAERWFEVWAAQGYVVVGSNSIPIPGAMGVADYLMMHAYGQFLPASEAVNLELLSRSISFYSCILFCGIGVLCVYTVRRIRTSKKTGKFTGKNGI